MTNPRQCPECDSTDLRYPTSAVYDHERDKYVIDQTEVITNDLVHCVSCSTNFSLAEVFEVD